MKRNHNHKVATAALGACWLSNVVALAKAIHYVRAAQRDERDGFPHTAAMEWRHAANLFAAETSAADYFWWQWERIMQLPRQLAGPIGDSRIGPFPVESASARRPTMEAAIHEISLTNAA